MAKAITLKGFLGNEDPAAVHEFKKDAKFTIEDPESPIPLPRKPLSVIILIDLDVPSYERIVIGNVGRSFLDIQVNQDDHAQGFPW
jgi:hypothetical protein